jgi:HlyD family secretion protein
MDREIGIRERRRRIVRRAAPVVVALAAAGFLLAASVDWLRPSIERRDIVTARVMRGTVESTLDASGAVVPLEEEVVSSPVEARVLRVDRRAGDRVRAGDALLTLDTAASAAEAARLGDRVAQQESAVSELRLRLDEELAKLRAQLEQKLLDAEIDRYTSQQKSRLRAEGLIAEQDALAAQTVARKSEIEIRQLREAIARSERSREVQLAASAAATSMVRREREESRRQLELAMLRAGRDGVVTSILGETGTTVRRGDVIARIADLSSYRVEGSISDVHASRLAAGQRAHVVLDGLTLDGSIESVDPRIVNGVVRFYVRLDQASHPALRNNLRVDVEVVTSTRKGALLVKRGSLGEGTASHAFVVRGGEAVRVPVRFGLAGRQTIEVVQGLREGDEIVISDMASYEDVAKLRLE